MGVRNNHRFAIARLALCALALAACAPAAIPPTTAPTAPPTATALPPTAAATAASTTANPNIPVPATSIYLDGPQDIAFDAQGNYYVSACGLNVSIVYKIDPAGLLTGFAGTGHYGFSGDGGPADLAELSCPTGLAFDGAGNLFVADSGSNVIRSIDRQGIIRTVAGTGDYDFSGDGGPAAGASFANPVAIAFDPGGNLYIVDNGNQRIRKVDRQGIVTTVAGNGTVGFSGDGGPAIDAEIDENPYWAGIAFDAQGNLYFADAFNARVRKVDQAGVITTVAGNGQPMIAGDNGPARTASLTIPTGLAFDGAGNLYIASNPASTTSDARIRKVDTHGIITTVIGTGPLGNSGDGGPASLAAIGFEASLVFAPSGELYLVDTGNQRIRKVDASGIITTVAGGHY